MSRAFTQLAKALKAVDAGRRVELAQAGSVAPRMAHRLAATAGRVNVRPFPAADFIGLCCSVGVHPLNGTLMAGKPCGAFVPQALACAAKMARFERKLSLRAAAKAWKVEQTALSRIESGIPVSVEPVMALCRALNRQPFDFLLAASAFHGKHKLQHTENANELVSA